MNERGKELLEGRVRILLYISSMWITSRESVWKARSSRRDDERMVVVYEHRLSDCSQDGMVVRKRECLICYAWLVWYLHQRMCLTVTNHERGRLEIAANCRQAHVLVGALF